MQSYSRLLEMPQVTQELSEEVTGIIMGTLSEELLGRFREPLT
jgi:hypothetical protein